MLVGPAFSVEPPRDWKIRRNYRYFGSSYLELETPDGRGAITIELIRASPAFRLMPLDLVAEGLIGERDRGFGVETLAMAEHEIVLDGHRAVALTGRRVHGPQRVDFTAIVARPDRHLLVLMLHAPEGTIGTYSMALERILDTLSLSRAPSSSETLEDW